MATSGCTSYFKRKECEKTNWFEHGKTVSERGEWLESDPFLNECRKVEAEIQESQLDLGFKSGRQKYCSKENSFAVGRKGRLFAKDLCQGPELTMLLSQHKSGVLEYCKSENAMEAGLSGLPYLNVCTTEQEKKFLPPFRVGRVKYLEANIAEKERQRSSIDEKVRALDRDRLTLEGRRRHLQAQKNSLESRKFMYASNPAADSQHHASMLSGQISSLESDIMSLGSQINALDSQGRNERAAAEALEQEISKMRIEAATLK